MSYLTQKTLKSDISFSGIALHSGLNTNVRIKPAEPDFGIVFKRVDLKFNNIVYPNFNNVTNTSLNTTVENEFGARVSTIEHLMGALFGLGIDNALIEIDNEEVPILDGSAKIFIDKIVSDQNLTILEKFHLLDEQALFIAGYRGATFDGDSVYYAPYYNNYDRRHGIMLKYDTNLPFDDPKSWSVQSVGQYGLGGFQGAVHHNKFVYYVPYYFEIDSDSRFLRYDTNKEFNDRNAWTAMPIFGAGAFEDAVVGGNFIYFSPHLDHSKERNALPLRYDTTKIFDDINAYEQYNSGLKISFIGANFDGKFVYYAPFESEYQDKNIILIYDTNKEFTDSDAWEELEIPYAQYSGIGFDGEQMVIAPHCHEENEKFSCPKILFLDTETREITFSEKSYGSYDGVIETDEGLFLVPDAYATGTRADFLMIKDGIHSHSPKIAKGGYWGGTFDGKYVYYAPYSFPDSAIRNGEFLRYDTTMAFDDESSWEIISFKVTDFEYNFGYEDLE